MMKKTINYKKASGLFALLLLSASTFAADIKVETKGIFDNDWNYFLGLLAIVQLLAFLVLSYVAKKVIATREIWKKKGSVILPVIGFMLLSNSTYAASVEVNSNTFDTNSWILLFVNVLLFVIILWMKGMLDEILEIATGKKRKKVSFSESFIDAPSELEESELMTDHEYDGIRELDNDLPGWWKGLFVVCILFSVVYIPYYHLGGGELQEQEYLTEMKQAEEEVAAYRELMGNMVDETNATVIIDADLLANAKNTFIKNCAACHGQSGGSSEFGVGPNLTDRYWLHGGDVKNVFKSIKYGIPAKGMKAWGKEISPKDIQAISSYILSLQGSNPENAKAPQGDLYEPTAEVTSTDSTAVVEN